ncbi:MAG: alpha/beta hydrolase [Alphaproteobacteria bacterium]
MNEPDTTIGELLGPSREPLNGQPAKHLVILLHGLGADGNDLIGLAPSLAPMLPDTAFVAPDAPWPCDMGPAGRQWFSLQEFSEASVAAGSRRAATPLNNFIDGQLSRLGLNDGQLALVGFSQGCMMALHVALRRPNCCAAVVGFSGMLVDSANLAAELVCRPPVLLVHGDADIVVPPACLPAAETALKALNVPVSAHMRPGLAHGIDGQGLALAGEFLGQAFAE